MHTCMHVYMHMCTRTYVHMCTSNITNKTGQSSAMPCLGLHSVTLRDIALHYITLRYVTLRCVACAHALRCTTYTHMYACIPHTPYIYTCMIIAYHIIIPLHIANICWCRACSLMGLKLDPACSFRRPRERPKLLHRRVRVTPVWPGPVH